MLTGNQTTTDKAPIKGYPLIARTTSFKERFVNDIGRIQGEEIVTEDLDMACYSHSPPDHPLEKYNLYRKKRFDKALVNIHAKCAEKIPENRDEYFVACHVRFPVDGTMSYVFCMRALNDERRRENPNTTSLNESTVKNPPSAETMRMQNQRSFIQNGESAVGSRSGWACCCPKKKGK